MSSLAKVLRYDAVVATGEEPGDLRMVAGVAAVNFTSHSQQDAQNISDTHAYFRVQIVVEKLAMDVSKASASPQESSRRETELLHLRVVHQMRRKRTASDTPTPVTHSQLSPCIAHAPPS